MDGNLEKKLKAMLMFYWVFKYVSNDYTPISWDCPNNLLKKHMTVPFPQILYYLKYEDDLKPLT